MEPARSSRSAGQPRLVSHQQAASLDVLVDIAADQSSVGHWGRQGGHPADLRSLYTPADSLLELQHQALLRLQGRCGGRLDNLLRIAAAAGRAALGGPAGGRGPSGVDGGWGQYLLLALPLHSVSHKDAARICLKSAGCRRRAQLGRGVCSPESDGERSLSSETVSLSRSTELPTAACPSPSSSPPSDCLPARLNTYPGGCVCGKPDCRLG